MPQIKDHNRMGLRVVRRCTSTATAGLVLLALSLLAITSAQPTSTALYTLVHSPGSLITGYEEGLMLQAPQGYAARQARYVHTTSKHSAKLGQCTRTNTWPDSLLLLCLTASYKLKSRLLQ